MKNYEKTRYTVYIRQHYKPIPVMANSKEEAKDLVQNHYTWGEPIDVEIVAKQSSLINTGEKDD